MQKQKTELDGLRLMLWGLILLLLIMVCSLIFQDDSPRQAPTGAVMVWRCGE